MTVCRREDSDHEAVALSERRKVACHEGKGGGIPCKEGKPLMRRI